MKTVGLVRGCDFVNVNNSIGIFKAESVMFNHLLAWLITYRVTQRVVFENLRSGGLRKVTVFSSTMLCGTLVL